MQRKEPESIGDVLRLTLQESSLAGRMDEVKASLMWAEMVGPGIAARTSRPQISCGIMVVYVDSAPLRHELTMNRSRIIDLINARMGKEVVRQIRFK